MILSICAVRNYECNIKHITHNKKEYEICIYNQPPTNFVTLINKMSHNRSTALERSVINYGGGVLNKVCSQDYEWKRKYFHYLCHISNDCSRLSTGNVQLTQPHMKNRQRQTNRHRDRQTYMHTLYPNKFMKNTIVGSENVWVRKAPVF